MSRPTTWLELQDVDLTRSTAPDSPCKKETLRGIIILPSLPGKYESDNYGFISNSGHIVFASYQEFTTLERTAASSTKQDFHKELIIELAEVYFNRGGTNNSILKQRINSTVKSIEDFASE